MLYQFESLLKELLRPIYLLRLAGSTSFWWLPYVPELNVAVFGKTGYPKAYNTSIDTHSTNKLTGIVLPLLFLRLNRPQSTSTPNAFLIEIANSLAIANFLLFYTEDYSLGIWFALSCLAFYSLFVRPFKSKHGNRRTNVIKLDSESFEYNIASLFNEPTNFTNQSMTALEEREEKQKHTWIVLFKYDNDHLADEIETVLDSLSSEFHSSISHFATFSLSQYPNYATKFHPSSIIPPRSSLPVSWKTRLLRSTGSQKSIPRPKISVFKNGRVISECECGGGVFKGWLLCNKRYVSSYLNLKNIFQIDEIDNK